MDLCTLPTKQFSLQQPINIACIYMYCVYTHAYKVIRASGNGTVGTAIAIPVL